MTTPRIAIIASLGAATTAAMAGTFVEFFNTYALRSRQWWRSTEIAVTLEPSNGRLVASNKTQAMPTVAMVGLRNLGASESASWALSASAEQLVPNDGSSAGIALLGLAFSVDPSDPDASFSGLSLGVAWDGDSVSANFWSEGQTPPETFVISSSRTYRFRGTLSATYNAKKDRLSLRVGNKTVTREHFYDLSGFTGTATPVLAAAVLTEDDRPACAFDNFSFSGPGVVPVSIDWD
jgi:hypothetical protein